MTALTNSTSVKVILAGTWWYRVRIGLLCLYILIRKGDIWSSVTPTCYGLTYSQTTKYMATQLA